MQSPFPIQTRRPLPRLGTIDELHKRLVASEIGVPSPVLLLRGGTERLVLIVTPRELRAQREGAPEPVRR